MTASHVGHSYGADKAATAAGYANKYDQEVTQSILIDPASVKARSLVGLMQDFGKTASTLDAYIEAANSNALVKARELALKRHLGWAGYVIGLGRLSNIAIAHALSKEGFEERVDIALTNQANMKANIIWGTESTLAVNGLMETLTTRLINKYGEKRVISMPLMGQNHCMVDDVFLHAALVLQNSKPTA